MKSTTLQPPCTDDAETAAQHPAISSILESCPIAGDGVNRWLFGAARKLHLLGLKASEIEELLEDGAADCGRELKADEIPRAVRNSAPGAIRNQVSRRSWPARNYEAIEAVGQYGIRLADLGCSSPVQFDASEDSAEAVIDVIFPGDPILCAGSSLSHCRTRPRKEWRGFLSRQSFIVPSSMTARKGHTRDGRLSFRSLENVGPRQFLVVEFDFVERNELGRETGAAPMLQRLATEGVTIADLCAALHGELAKLRPLAVVVDSAGKSLHGWYPCAGDDEKELHRFMRFAVSLGADSATWVRVQFVRMPGGIRDNGKRQRVIYFNPAVLNGGGR